MWKKPEIKKPSFKKGNIEKLEKKELEKVNGGGGGVGTCAVVGYACWNSGEFHLGVCVILGGWFD